MKKSEKTKRQLADAFKELMLTKPLEKISIFEVTEKAELNRQTFYYHFENIYDLLKWTLEREALESLADYKDELRWKDGYKTLLVYLEENRTFALNIINSIGHEHFNRFFKQEIYGVVEFIVEQISCGIKDVEETYKNFITHFFTISITAITISWLQGEMDFTVDEQLAMVERFVREHIQGTRLLYEHNEQNT